MTRQEIAEKIIALLKEHDIVNAVYALADEVANDNTLDTMLCENCKHLCEHVTVATKLYSCFLTGMGTHPSEPCHCFQRRK